MRWTEGGQRSPWGRDSEQEEEEEDEGSGDVSPSVYSELLVLDDPCFHGKIFYDGNNLPAKISIKKLFLFSPGFHLNRKIWSDLNYFAVNFLSALIEMFRSIGTDHNRPISMKKWTITNHQIPSPVSLRSITSCIEEP